MQISVIVPMFNEIDNVAPLVERVTTILGQLGRPFEIILVDDGSSDGTTGAIARLERQGRPVRGVFLARNYGQSTAMQAGFDAARGEIIVSMDGDMQNDPADIPRMIELMETTGADVVGGWRRHRQDDSLRMLFSRVANRLIRRLTKVPLHDFGCSLRVYRRDILERTRLYGEMHRFMLALLAEVGAEMVEMEVRHHPRRFGTSKYRLDRTFRVLMDLLLVVFIRRYIQRPLHFFGFGGFAFMVPGGAILLYLSAMKIFTGAGLAGRPLLILGVLMVLLGIMLFGMGLLGEVLSRLLHHSGGYPHYHTKPPRKIEGLLLPPDDRASAA